MVPEVIVRYYALGIKEDIPCNLSLYSENNSNIISFESDKCVLKIVLKDVVDLEEFYNLLTKKERKGVVYCYMKKEDKEYKGLRKIVWKNDALAISQGGIRLEFEKDIQDRILESIKIIKNKLGI
jgi:hypothetical protein